METANPGKQIDKSEGRAIRPRRLTHWTSPCFFRCSLCPAGRRWFDFHGFSESPWFRTYFHPRILWSPGQYINVRAYTSHVKCGHLSQKTGRAGKRGDYPAKPSFCIANCIVSYVGSGGRRPGGPQRTARTKRSGCPCNRSRSLRRRRTTST